MPEQLGRSNYASASTGQRPAGWVIATVTLAYLQCSSSSQSRSCCQSLLSLLASIRPRHSLHRALSRQLVSLASGCPLKLSNSSGRPSNSLRNPRYPPSITSTVGTCCDAPRAPDCSRRVNHRARREAAYGPRCWLSMQWRTTRVLDNTPCCCTKREDEMTGFVCKGRSPGTCKCWRARWQLMDNLHEGMDLFIRLEIVHGDVHRAPQVPAGEVVIAHVDHERVSVAEPLRGTSLDMLSLDMPSSKIGTAGCWICCSPLPPALQRRTTGRPWLAARLPCGLSC